MIAAADSPSATPNEQVLAQLTLGEISTKRKAADLAPNR